MVMRVKSPGAVLMMQASLCYSGVIEGQVLRSSLRWGSKKLRFLGWGSSP